MSKIGKINNAISKGTKKVIKTLPFTKLGLTFIDPPQTMFPGLVGIPNLLMRSTQRKRNAD
jgi:hypothetical protein